MGRGRFGSLWCDRRARDWGRVMTTLRRMTVEEFMDPHRPVITMTEEEFMGWMDEEKQDASTPARTVKKGQNPKSLIRQKE